jgi:hypothetical protein
MPVRSFSVPAGTVLKSGFVVPETVAIRLDYAAGEYTPGQAQKRAGDLALRELQNRYGQSRTDAGGFAGLQRSTREVQAATPSRAPRPGEAAAPARARGGRQRVVPQFPFQEAQGGRVVNITLGKPSPVFATIREQTQQAFLAYPDAISVAVIGSGRLTVERQREYNLKRAVQQGPAMRNARAFDAFYPDPKTFQDKMGLQLAGADWWVLQVRLAPPQSQAPQRKRRPGRSSGGGKRAVK